MARHPKDVDNVAAEGRGEEPEPTYWCASCGDYEVAGPGMDCAECWPVNGSDAVADVPDEDWEGDCHGI